MIRKLLSHPVNTTTLDHRMKLYSLAAAAAGVSALALSQSAEAKVVITNTNIPVPACVQLTPCNVAIDLNGDGVTDLKIALLSTFDYSKNILSLLVSPQNGGGVVGTTPRFRHYASALLRGAKIGASDHFVSGRSDLVEESLAFYGQVDYPL